VQPGDQTMVSVTNLTDESKEAGVRFFADACGEPAQGRLTIEPERTGVLDEPCADNIDTYTIRARVTALGTWLKKAPVTLQILNDSGQTLGHVAAGTAGISGTGHGSMMHVASEHGVRVLATNLGKTTASFTITLVDQSGGVAASMTISNLAPGATGVATSVEPDDPDVRAVVTGPTDTKYLARAELFEEASGRTILADTIDGNHAQ
jgi:hypothetical protein